MDNEITIVEQFATPNGKVFIGAYVTSSYVEPTDNIAMGSWLYQVDTGTLRMFNELTGAWKTQ